MDGGRRQEGLGPAGARSQCIQVELMGSNRKRLNVCAPPYGLKDYGLCRQTHTHAHMLSQALAQSCTSSFTQSLFQMLTLGQSTSQGHSVLHLSHKEHYVSSPPLIYSYNRLLWQI